MIRKKAAQATPIRDIVKGLISKIDEEKKIGEDELNLVWKEIVGQKAAQHTTPSSLFRKKIKILVNNSGWAHELTLSKKKILRKLQSRFGKDNITDIAFKTSE